MYQESSSSSKRIKIAGAVLAAVALVIVGVVALNNADNNTPVVTLEKAQAIAHVESANLPISEVPDESAVETPEGWVIESDEPVEGAGSEEEEESEEGEGFSQEAAEADDDIDSPHDFEEDKDGEKYVAELDDDVIVTGDGEQQETAVAADGKKKYYKKCYKGLKACGAKRACTKRCKKKCKPYAVRKCNRKKFCRCFCKYYGKIKKARRCVVYKRKVCRNAVIYRCRRACKKTCQKVLRCYCCPRRKIRQKCRKLCRKYMYQSKCKKCRCAMIKCIKRCRFVCTHRYY